MTIPVSCCLPRCMSNCVIILSWHAAGSAASAASCIPPPPPSTCPSLSHLASHHHRITPNLQYPAVTACPTRHIQSVIASPSSENHKYSSFRTTDSKHFPTDTDCNLVQVTVTWCILVHICVTWCTLVKPSCMSVTSRPTLPIKMPSYSWNNISCSIQSFQ